MTEADFKDRLATMERIIADKDEIIRINRERAETGQTHLKLLQEDVTSMRAELDNLKRSKGTTDAELKDLMERWDGLRASIEEIYNTHDLIKLTPPPPANASHRHLILLGAIGTALSTASRTLEQKIAQVTDYSKRNGELGKQVIDRDVKLEEATKKIAELEGQLAAKKEDWDDLHSDLVELKAEYDKVEADLKLSRALNDEGAKKIAELQAAKKEADESAVKMFWERDAMKTENDRLRSELANLRRVAKRPMPDSQQLTDAALHANNALQAFIAMATGQKIDIRG